LSEADGGEQWREKKVQTNRGSKEITNKISLNYFRSVLGIASCRPAYKKGGKVKGVIQIYGARKSWDKKNYGWTRGDRKGAGYV